MLVIGYRQGADFVEAKSAIAKHTMLKPNVISSFLKALENEGQTFSLSDDFVLEDDLKAAGFFIIH
jgi:hypothetical protein